MLQVLVGELGQVVASRFAHAVLAALVPLLGAPEASAAHTHTHTYTHPALAGQIGGGGEESWVRAGGGGGGQGAMFSARKGMSPTLLHVLFPTFSP